MNEDCLKLTSYFGERQRTADNGFAADALLDLYGRRGIATSILLRGAEGFGARQRLRTDRSLSLSDDLPLTTVAVDTRARIAVLLEPTADLLRSGLVTLERARLLTGDILAGDIEGVEVLAPGEETKLTVYLGRQERVYRVPAFVAVCDLLHRRGIAGATALLGVDGTAHGKRERAAFFSRNAGTPMMVIAVGSGAQIARVLPELGGLLRQPMLTLERVRICKRDGELLSRPPTAGEGQPVASPPLADETQLPPARKLMVYTSEAALHGGQPIHRTIVRRLRAAGIGGATTTRGMWGFHGAHPPHGDRLLQLGRQVPAVTIVIDAPERIQAAFDIIDDLTAEQGLVTCETVPVARQARPALLLAAARSAMGRYDRRVTTPAPNLIRLLADTARAGADPLASRDEAVNWLRAAGLLPVDADTTLTGSEHGALLRLRDSLRDVLAARADRRPDADAAARLTRALADGRLVVTIDTGGASGLASSARATYSNLVAAIAIAAAETLRK